jgi:DHA2 family lincomycin resistance protein-like MFS transporter
VKVRHSPRTPDGGIVSHPTTPENVTNSEATDRLDPKSRMVLILLLAAVFVVFLNETTMSVAIPTIIADLRITAAEGQWLTTGYALTMAVVIPITGWLLQRLNTRPVFILAMSVFTAGTLIAATAPVFEVLVAGRIVQATGTAIMMPLMMTTVMTIIPPSIRGRIMGRISMVMSLAPAIGPTVAGFLLQAFDGYWRGLFFVMLPLAIVMLVLGVVLVPNVTETRRIPLDAASVVLSALGFSTLVYGLSSIGLAAESAALVSPWLPIAVGVGFLVAFVFRQFALQRRDVAFLDLRTFRARTFTLAIVMFSLAMLMMFGIVITMPIYLQYGLLQPTEVIGLVVLPGALLMGLLGPTVGRLYDRVGPRPLVIPGAIAISASVWAFAFLLAADSSVWLVAGIYTVMFLGFAFLFSPLFAASLGSLPSHLYSHGSALVATIQQVAGAAGAAVFVALFTISLAGSGTTEVQSAEPAAIADAVKLAFLAGAFVSLGMVVTALFVRKPAAPEISDASLTAEAEASAH